MHEFGVARDLVLRSIQEAEKHASEKVAAMHILLGPDQHLDGESLAFSILAAARGTIAEDTQVFISVGTEDGVVLETIEVEDRHDVCSHSG